MRELLASVDSRELTEWQMYYQLEAEERQRESLASSARAGLDRARRGRR